MRTCKKVSFVPINATLERNISLPKYGYFDFNAFNLLKCKVTHNFANFLTVDKKMQLEQKYEAIIDQILTSHYGVLDDFLSSSILDGLRASFSERKEADAFRKAGISKNQAVVEKIRGDEIFWLNEENATEAENHFLTAVRDFSNYLNRTCYLGITNHEFHYASYPVGTFYKRHLDRFQSDSSRKLSLICYLNEDWKTEDGGQLRLYLADNELDILPIGGRIVVFESDKIEHEVLPATRERRSVTGWLRGNER